MFLKRATSEIVRRDFKPLTVAFTTFAGVFEPNDFVNIFSIPAASKIARAGPPAMIPVPGAAGLSMILLAPNLPTISWGIVPLTIGTRNMLTAALSLAF